MSSGTKPTSSQRGLCPVAQAATRIHSWCPSCHIHQAVYTHRNQPWPAQGLKSSQRWCDPCRKGRFGKETKPGPGKKLRAVSSENLGSRYLECSLKKRGFGSFLEAIATLITGSISAYREHLRGPGWGFLEQCFSNFNFIWITKAWGPEQGPCYWCLRAVIPAIF